MSLDINILYFLIIGCEIAFWVMLFSGFAIRYVLGDKKLSFYVLISVPLIDLFLLMFTVIDLNNGNSASFAHGLAAAYIGFTVAFGSILISWADKWFAFKFAGGTQPATGAKGGWPPLIEDFKLWFRCIGAVAIIYVLLISMTKFVADPSKTESLQIWFRIPFFTVFFWFIFGPLWSLVFFKKETNN